MEGARPALLLDVDGVLNVFPRSELLALLLGRDPDTEPTGRVEVHQVAAEDGTVYTLRIRPEYGGWLRTLAVAYELVWATTWGATANTRISPLLGIPDDLEVVPMPDAWTTRHEVLLEGVSRKVPWIREWATARGIETLAWVDDEIDVGDGWALTAGRSPVRAALPLPADPFRGLTSRHVDVLTAWADSGFDPDLVPDPDAGPDA